MASAPTINLREYRLSMKDSIPEDIPDPTANVSRSALLYNYTYVIDNDDKHYENEFRGIFKAVSWPKSVEMMASNKTYETETFVYGGGSLIYGIRYSQTNSVFKPAKRHLTNRLAGYSDDGVPGSNLGVFEITEVPIRGAETDYLGYPDKFSPALKIFETANPWHISVSQIVKDGDLDPIGLTETVLGSVYHIRNTETSNSDESTPVYTDQMMFMLNPGMTGDTSTFRKIPRQTEDENPIEVEVKENDRKDLKWGDFGAFAVSEFQNAYAIAHRRVQDIDDGDMDFNRYKHYSRICIFPEQNSNAKKPLVITRDVVSCVPNFDENHIEDLVLPEAISGVSGAQKFFNVRYNLMANDDEQGDKLKEFHDSGAINESPNNFDGTWYDDKKDNFNTISQKKPRIDGVLFSYGCDQKNFFPGVPVAMHFTAKGCLRLYLEDMTDNGRATFQDSYYQGFTSIIVDIYFSEAAEGSTGPAFTFDKAVYSYKKYPNLRKFTVPQKGDDFYYYNPIHGGMLRETTLEPVCHYKWWEIVVSFLVGGVAGLTYALLDLKHCHLEVRNNFLYAPPGVVIVPNTRSSNVGAYAEFYPYINLVSISYDKFNPTESVNSDINRTVYELEVDLTSPFAFYSTACFGGKEGNHLFVSSFRYSYSTDLNPLKGLIEYKAPQSVSSYNRTPSSPGPIYVYNVKPNAPTSEIGPLGMPRLSPVAKLEINFVYKPVEDSSVGINFLSVAYSGKRYVPGSNPRDNLGMLLIFGSPTIAFEHPLIQNDESILQYSDENYNEVRDGATAFIPINQFDPCLIKSAECTAERKMKVNQMYAILPSVASSGKLIAKDYSNEDVWNNETKTFDYKPEFGKYSEAFEIHSSLFDTSKNKDTIIDVDASSAETFIFTIPKIGAHESTDVSDCFTVIHTTDNGFRILLSNASKFFNAAFNALNGNFHEKFLLSLTVDFNHLSALMFNVMDAATMNIRLDHTRAAIVTGELTVQRIVEHCSKNPYLNLKIALDTNVPDYSVIKSGELFPIVPDFYELPAVNIIYAMCLKGEEMMKDELDNNKYTGKKTLDIKQNLGNAVFENDLVIYPASFFEAVAAQAIKDGKETSDYEVVLHRIVEIPKGESFADFVNVQNCKKVGSQYQVIDTTKEPVNVPEINILMKKPIFKAIVNGKEELKISTAVGGEILFDVNAENVESIAASHITQRYVEIFKREDEDITDDVRKNEIHINSQNPLKVMFTPDFGDSSDSVNYSARVVTEYFGKYKYSTDEIAVTVVFPNFVKYVKATNIFIGATLQVYIQDATVLPRGVMFELVEIPNVYVKKDGEQNNSGYVIDEQAKLNKQAIITIADFDTLHADGGTVKVTSTTGNGSEYGNFSTTHVYESTEDMDLAIVPFELKVLTLTSPLYVGMTGTFDIDIPSGAEFLGIGPMSIKSIVLNPDHEDKVKRVSDLKIFIRKAGLIEIKGSVTATGGVVHTSTDYTQLDVPQPRVSKCPTEPEINNGVTMVPDRLSVKFSPEDILNVGPGFKMGSDILFSLQSFIPTLNIDNKTMTVQSDGNPGEVTVYPSVVVDGITYPILSELKPENDKEFIAIDFNFILSLSLNFSHSDGSTGSNYTLGETIVVDVVDEFQKTGTPLAALSIANVSFSNPTAAVANVPSVGSRFRFACTELGPIDVAVSVNFNSHTASPIVGVVTIVPLEIKIVDPESSKHASKLYAGQSVSLHIDQANIPGSLTLGKGTWFFSDDVSTYDIASLDEVRTHIFSHPSDVSVIADVILNNIDVGLELNLSAETNYTITPAIHFSAFPFYTIADTATFIDDGAYFKSGADNSYTSSWTARSILTYQSPTGLTGATGSGDSSVVKPYSNISASGNSCSLIILPFPSDLYTYPYKFEVALSVDVKFYPNGNQSPTSRITVGQITQVTTPSVTFVCNTPKYLPPNTFLEEQVLIFEPKIKPSLNYTFTSEWKAEIPSASVEGDGVTIDNTQGPNLIVAANAEGMLHVSLMATFVVSGVRVSADPVTQYFDIMNPVNFTVKQPRLPWLPVIVTGSAPNSKSVEWKVSNCEYSNGNYRCLGDDVFPDDQQKGLIVRRFEFTSVEKGRSFCISLTGHYVFEGSSASITRTRIITLVPAIAITAPHTALAYKPVNVKAVVDVTPLSVEWNFQDGKRYAKVVNVLNAVHTYSEVTEPDKFFSIDVTAEFDNGSGGRFRDTARAEITILEDAVNKEVAIEGAEGTSVSFASVAAPQRGTEAILKIISSVIVVIALFVIMMMYVYPLAISNGYS